MKKQIGLLSLLFLIPLSACDNSPAPRQFTGKKIVSLASPIKRAEKVDTAAALAKMEDLYAKGQADVSFGGRRRGSNDAPSLRPESIQVLSNGWGVSRKQLTGLYQAGLLDRYLYLHPEVLAGFDFEKLFPSYFGRLLRCPDCRINTVRSKTQFLTGQFSNPAVNGRGVQPDVAYDSDRQHYLIVWNERGSNGESLVYARLVDRDGVTTLFGFDRRLISTPRGANGCLQDGFTTSTGLSMPTNCRENVEPSVAYNGGRFFIVWTLKGRADHPAETPFSVILGQMVDALTLDPIQDAQAGDIWAGGRLISQVSLYSNRGDCTRGQSCAPRNDDEIQSWSSHEKPQLVPLTGESAFFTVWQTNRDFISCRDSERWSSRSVYGRLIGFNFGPGRTNKELVRIYSDRSNNLSDPDHPEYATQCAAKADVTTVDNPRVAVNPQTRKVLTVFETHKNEANAASSISGQLFTFNGSLDVQSGLDPWNAIPVYSQDGNSFNPDVVDFDDKFLVANDLNKTSLVLQIFGTSENRLQRIGDPVIEEIRDGSVSKKARRPRLLVATNGEFVVSYEKRTRVDDLPSEIELTSLNANLNPIGERVTLTGVDSEGEAYPTNFSQELASGERDLLTVWAGQRSVTGGEVENQIFSSLVNVEPTVHVNERPTAVIEVLGVGLVPEVTVAPGTTIRLSGAGSSDPENGTDLRYEWSQTVGTPVLTTLDQVETSFVAPSSPDNVAQTLTIQLQVTDLDQPPLVSEPVSVTVHITPTMPMENNRPTARINDQFVTSLVVDETETEPPYARTEVILNSSGSNDGEPDIVQPLTYLWTNDSTDLELQTDDRSATYSFLAPDISTIEGRRTVVVQLRVNDGQAENAESELATATVEIRFVNRVPTIDVGPDRDVNEGDDVQVRASVSDLDGQEVTVTWRRVSGAAVTFTQEEEGGRLLHFTANQVASDTPVVFEATASDGTLTSAAERIEIMIHNLPGPTAPVLQTPSDGSIYAPTRVFLKWDASSGGTGAVSYTVLFDTEDPPLTEAVDCRNLTDRRCVVSSLRPETTYYWRVQARDTAGNTILSPVFRINTDNSLVGWWRFDGDTSDSSGNGNNGTFMGDDDGDLSNNFFSTGSLGQALRFDAMGMGDRLDLSPFPFVALSSGTIETWVNRDTEDGGGLLYFGRNSDPAPTNKIYFGQWLDSAHQRIVVGGPGGGELLLANWLVPPAGQWNHLVYTTDVAGNRVFVNSTQQALEYNAGDPSTRAFFADVTGADGMTLGCLISSDAVGSCFSGLMGETAIYNRPLFPAEVQNNFCAFQALSGFPLPPICE